MELDAKGKANHLTDISCLRVKRKSPQRTGIPNRNALNQKKVSRLKYAVSIAVFKLEVHELKRVGGIIFPYYAVQTAYSNGEAPWSTFSTVK